MNRIREKPLYLPATSFKGVKGAEICQCSLRDDMFSGLAFITGQGIFGYELLPFQEHNLTDKCKLEAQGYLA